MPRVALHVKAHGKKTWPQGEQMLALHLAKVEQATVLDIDLGKIVKLYEFEARGRRAAR